MTVYETTFPDGYNLVYFIFEGVTYKFIEDEIFPASMAFDDEFFKCAVALEVMRAREATLKEQMEINAELAYWTK